MWNSGCGIDDIACQLQRSAGVIRNTIFAMRAAGVDLICRKGGKPKSKWTVERTERLTQWLADGVSIQTIAFRLQVTGTTVRRKADDLGLSRVRREAGKPWTDEDVAMLCELYCLQELSVTKVAQCMGRPVGSVHYIISMFGFARNGSKAKSDYSEPEPTGPPAEPCMSGLGSQGRIDTMRDRLTAGVELRHKDDDPICREVKIDKKETST